MHTYLIVKGVKSNIDKWAQDLAGMWIRVWKKGKPLREKRGEKEIDVYTQVHVREVKLYEIGYPKEEEDYVMNILGIRKANTYILERYPILKKIFNIVRKRLGLKPVKDPTNPLELMMPNQVVKAVGIIPIGNKEDAFDDDGFEQL